MPAPVSPHLSRLGIEREIADAMFPRRGGLVLVAGETGSGRTSILEAAVATAHKGWRTWEDGGLDRGAVMLSEAAGHYPPAPHWPTFPRPMDVGIRIAMRDGQDVICVDGLRGPEAVLQAVKAAGHGHAVIAAVEADTVPGALCLVEAEYAASVPDADRRSARQDLLKVVHMILLQRRLPATGGGQVWTREYVLLGDGLRDTLAGSDASRWEDVIAPHVAAPPGPAEAA